MNVNGKSDSLQDRIESIVGTSVMPREISLLCNDETWNETWRLVFLRMFAQITGESVIRSQTTNNQLLEPIMVYYCKNNGLSLIFSKLMLVTLLCAPHKLTVESERRSISEYRPPNCFRMRSNGSSNYSDNDNTDNVNINDYLSNKLLMIYTCAEHTAYHYMCALSRKNGDADYDHAHIANPPQRYISLTEMIDSSINTSNDKRIYTKKKKIPGCFVYSVPEEVVDWDGDSSVSNSSTTDSNDTEVSSSST